MDKFFLTILSIVAVSFNFYGQEAISNSEKEEVISSIQTLISENYVFQNKVDSINSSLVEKSSNGEYDSIDSYDAFAEALTTDLRVISNDKHFRVFYDSIFPYDEKELIKRRLEYERFSNYGFSRMEIFDGNIGYFKLDYFAQPNKRILKTVFDYLKNVRGIIADLRDNNGGSNKMTRLILSYFIDKRTEIGTFHYSSGKSKKLMTIGSINCGNLSEIPMVVLLSKYSFSSAESFGYTLKHLHRATIVGETTEGGAHSVRGHKINETLSISIPYSNMINPITKTNWEGVGVIPDVQSDYQNAVRVGYINVLESLVEKATQEETKRYYQNIIDGIGKNGP